jgi:hypothetical protein
MSMRSSCAAMSLSACRVAIGGCVPGRAAGQALELDLVERLVQLAFAQLDRGNPARRAHVGAGCR